MTRPPWVPLGLTPGIDPTVAGRACLFVDVDGTLVDFVDRPEAVLADAALIALLGELFEASGGAVALISGRTIDALDAIFAPLRLPAAGLHGFERRDAGHHLHRDSIYSVQLNQARAHLGAVAARHPGLQLEDKRYALALHFRRAPQAEPVVWRAMAAALAKLAPRFELLSGDRVLEIKPTGYSKATAVEAYLEERPFQGRMPVYLGDDVTDLDGFEAVRRQHGVDIAVGGRVSARWSLAAPAAVRAWLRSLLEPNGDPA